MSSNLGIEANKFVIERSWLFGNPADGRLDGFVLSDHEWREYRHGNGCEHQ